MLHIYFGNKEASSCSECILNEEENWCTGFLAVCLFVFEFGGMPGDITYIHAYTNFVWWGDLSKTT